MCDDCMIMPMIKGDSYMSGYSVKIMRKLCRPMSINQLSPVVDNKLSTIVNNRISAVVNTLSTVPLENLQLHSEPFSHRPDLIWNLICFRTQTFVAEMFQALVCQA